MRVFLVVISICFYSTSIAQISFEKGFFINNKGEETKCLIKNMDWKYNPTYFYYKLSHSQESKKKTIKEVAMFGVIGKSEFIRTNVSIDRSSEKINKLSDKREPEFKKETLFLRKLIIGKFNLYSYEIGGLSRFFYNINEDEIVQLIFKSYKTENGNRRENNRFKQQLWNSLECSSNNKDDFQKIKYNKSSLSKLFKSFNECVSSEYRAFYKSSKSMKIKFSLKPGINFSSLNIDNVAPDERNIANIVRYKRNIEFEKNINFRLGIEAEFILPFNNGKWSCFLEPTYQYYKSEKELEINETATITKISNVKVDYSSLELGIGVRHYMFLSEKSKLFANLLCIIDVPLSNSIIKDSEDIINLEIMTDPNIVFGVGYTHSDKYSLEFRIGGNRNLLSGYLSWFSDYKSSSVVFGYKF